MPQPSQDQDPVSRLMHGALLGVLNAEPDPQLQLRVQRFRSVGTALLLMAILCMIAIGLLTATNLRYPKVSLGFGLAALLFLLSGAWLLDKAGKDELNAYHNKNDVLQDALFGAKGLPSHSNAHRRLYFGRSLIILACFCICVAAVPFPNKEPSDVVVWAGFSVLLLLVGWRQIDKAFQEQRQIGQKSELALRSWRGSGPHIRRVK